MQFTGIKNRVLIIALLAITKLGYAGECGPEQMSIRGSFNAWNATAMSCTDGAWEFTGDFAANSHLKFDVKGDWSENYGDNAVADGKADANGSNIVIHAAGKYSVLFNYRTKVYVISASGVNNACVTATMYLRRASNKWLGEAMICEAGVWKLAVPFGDNDEFKFDTANDWRDNYGDNLPRDTHADKNGANILATASGTYVVRFNYIGKSYMINASGSTETPATACGASKMSIRGSFNNWLALPMDCVDNVWSAVIFFPPSGGEFKFDVNGDWAENYGTTGTGRGALAPNGQNIVVSGGAPAYRVQFDYAANPKTYQITPDGNR